MFKKFVSNLPFSPALVGQIGFYARRLQQEQAARRLGLVLTVLALVLQSFAIFAPPNQALASSANDLIPGGAHSQPAALQAYDQGSEFTTLLNYLGIVRSDLVGMSQTAEQRCAQDSSLIIFGRQPIFSASENELMYEVPSNGQTLHFYSRPLNVFDKHKPVCHTVFAGTSAVAGNFAILADSGNLLLHQQPQPNPSSQTVQKSKTARSLTTNQELGQNTSVRPSERIEYHLQTKNTSDQPITYTVTEPLADTLEYAQLIDAGGASFNDATKTLTWNNITIAPGATDVRVVVVQIFSSIHAVPYSASNPSSYDCTITNIYGNTLTIPVDCPAIKTVESTVGSLPTIGPGGNIAFGGSLLVVVAYLYARNRQLVHEVKLVRHEFNAGAL